MKVLNYNLTGGNYSDLITRKAQGSEIICQIWYTGLIATNVYVEAWLTTDEGEPYAKIPDSETYLVPADQSAYLSLASVNGATIQFRLVVPTASTEGVITKVNVLY